MNLLFRCLLLVALCGSFAAQAQTKLPPRGRVQPKPRMGAGNPGAAVKDGLTMKTGRSVLTELGVTNPLTTDKKLVNGATITTTGLVTCPLASPRKCSKATWYRSRAALPCTPPWWRPTAC